MALIEDYVRGLRVRLGGLIRKDEDSAEHATVELLYPRANDRGPKVRFLHIDLEDVRASDGIRVSYDFDRDGWKIEQPRVLIWDGDDPVCDPEWTETAFVQSWAVEKPEPEPWR